MNKSLATINSPEFINLQPLEINPLMRSCEIKVLYLGENRNGTFISKEAAISMAKTLRGAPIVGYWKEEKEDFRDHGEVVIIDDEGIKFECKTVPYGFVSPDAKVWFKEFEDENDFGEKIIREYLMTNGYLWTGQFKECESVFEGDGKPQSMELDEETLNGHWDTNKRGMDFFIINDAIFSKLCILGEDVEPCFEGAKVGEKDVSASFTKVDNTFKKTLFTMMQELKTALEGGQQMDNIVVENAVVEESIVEPVAEFVAEPTVEPETPVEPSFAASEEPVIEDGAVSVPTPSDEPVAQEPAPAQAEEPVEPETPIEPTVEEQYSALRVAHEELQASFSALQANYDDLQTRFTALETAHAELVEFKRQSDDAKKDEIIGKFYMLSDDDKKDVIENKAKYTVEEIEEKLSVIGFRKKVNFDLKNETETPAYTVNISSVSGTSKPAWLSAVDQNKNRNI